MVTPSLRPRVYASLLDHHATTRPQVALLTGSRRVGITTLCRAVSDHCLDLTKGRDHSFLALSPLELGTRLGQNILRPPLNTKPKVAIDGLLDDPGRFAWLENIHPRMLRRMSFFLSGHQSLEPYESALPPDLPEGVNPYNPIEFLEHVMLDPIHLQTPSSRPVAIPHFPPERYWLFRIHPWSVGECARTTLPSTMIQAPMPIPSSDWDALWEHGGYPEPFLHRSQTYSTRWRTERQKDLLRHASWVASRTKDGHKCQRLLQALQASNGRSLWRSHLSGIAEISEPTLDRWLKSMDRLCFGFEVHPWSVRVPQALRKQPIWFLRDWSGISDPLKRARTFVACHLKKAVEGWTDLGFGSFELRYIRKKGYSEPTLLVVKDHRPWFVVATAMEPASSVTALTNLAIDVGALHAFLVVMNLPFTATDCFAGTRTQIVPAPTFLSQLP